jgi:hypothetical protein
MLGMITMAPTAKADWAYTRWGMTPEQVAKASNGGIHVIPEAERKTVEDAKLRTGAEGTYKDGDLTLNVGFSFDTTTGGLKCVFYSVSDGRQNAVLRDLLVKRFGEPSGRSSLPAIGMNAMNWDKPDEIYLQWVKENPANVMHCRNA